MAVLGCVLLLTAALCCDAAPADGSCPKPPRKDIEELIGEWEEDSYPKGTTVDYRCRPGYSRFGSLKIVCAEGSWRNIGRGECRKKPCGHPGEAKFGSFELIEGDSFVFGAIVEYKCDEGYQMASRHRRRECTPSGWTNDVPHCDVMNCPPIVAKPNVNVLSTSYDEEYTLGQVVRFECKDRNLMLKGDAEIFCTAEGKWSGEPPECQDISCPSPDIKNGEVPDRRFAIYRNDDTIQFTCKEGFRPSNSREIKCTKDGWIPHPSCEEITCNPYTPVENGRLDIKGSLYKFDDVIELKCDEGYTTQNQQSTFSKCTSNGWSPAPRCVSKACERPNIKNGRIAYTQDYSYPKSVGRYIDYKCNDNFWPLQRTYWSRIYCTATGWNPEPKCLRTCASQKVYFDNANIQNVQAVYLEGDTARFQCKDGYTTPDGWKFGERTCLPNGEFTSAICSKSCRAPVLTNGKFSPVKEIYEMGESLQYTCNEGYMTEKRQSGSRAECGSTGWSEQPSCKRISCKYDRTYNFRDVVKYTCPDGERPQYESGQCFRYGWGPPPNCLPIRCLIPDDPNIILSPHWTSYLVGSEVEFSCKEGSDRTGPLTRVCTEDGWDPPSPRCKEVKTCRNPPRINNGAITESSRKQTYVTDDIVTYSCDHGYHLVGPKQITCANEQWTGKPTCTKDDTSSLPEATLPPRQIEENNTSPDTEQGEKKPFTPKATDALPDNEQGERKKCPPAYNPINAEIIDPKEEYYSNDAFTMKCLSGYKINGSPEIQCIDGKWEQPPECIQVKPCGNPPRINNGDITESSRKREAYVTDDMVTYSCDRGFHLVGPEQSTCVNGQWTGKTTCTENSCEKPPAGGHSSVIERRETFSHGEKAKYECEPGFRFSVSGEDSATCVKGEWENIPDCIASSCTSLPKIYNARMTGQRKASYMSGETFTYECTPGYTMEPYRSAEAECKNTQWIIGQECRQIGAQCGPPPPLDHGDILGISKANYKHGETVEYQCPNFYVLQGNKKLKCENGQWQKPPVCLVPCTASEKDMATYNIQFKHRSDRKLYSTHGDWIEFICNPGYDPLPDFSTMRIQCNEGKLDYPKCFRRGFCVLDQSAMINNNIHYNVSTIVDNGVTVTFQCYEGMVPENNLEAKCDRSKIIYPRCTATRSCETPKIKDGSLKDPSQKTYESGSSVEFQCKKDYVIDGPTTVTCKNGEWTDLPKCHSPCKLSEEDLTTRNITPLPSDEQRNIFEISHQHGAQLHVSCIQGFKRQNQAALAIECDDGKFKFTRCLSGKPCRIEQEKIDGGNLILDDVHDNEVLYGEGETVQFNCKSGYYYRGKPTGKCSDGVLSYQNCTEITCNPLQAVPKGKLIATKTVYKYDDEIQVRCDNGYVLQTEPDKPRKCTSYGWSPPAACVRQRPSG